MDWYLDQSIKYWKNTSVISGAMGFIFLAQAIVFSALLELLKLFTPSGYPSFLIESLFQGISAASIIFFILLLIAGILASRGNTIGVIMGLILSVIILLILLLFSMSAGVAGVLAFPLLLGTSPQALLSLFNVYYSIRALKNKIEGIAMSICRFFSCSLQSSVAILAGITALVTIVLMILSAAATEFLSTSLTSGRDSSSLLSAMIGTGFILLFIAFILIFYSERIIFNNDEETLPKKRIYLLLLISIFILFITSGIIPIFGSLIGIFAIPFTVFSLGFVVAMPKKEFIMETMEHRPSSQVFPRIETIMEVRQEYAPKPEPMTSRIKVVGIKYCRYCGRIIPADSIYCEHCGRRLR